MLGKEADLLKAALVNEAGDALARGELAGGMVFVDALFAAAEFEFGAPVAKVGNLVGHRGLLCSLCLLGHPCSWFSRNEFGSWHVALQPLCPTAGGELIERHFAPRRSSSSAASSCCCSSRFRRPGREEHCRISGFWAFPHDEVRPNPAEDDLDDHARIGALVAPRRSAPM